MKIRRLVCAVAILCCASSAAFADGTVFVQGIAKPHIPDQSVLITFDGKMERLVIETAVEGEGMEFAWVVPVPSMPKVEAATPGLFPTLRAITGDRLIGFDGRRWFSAGLAALLGILIWWGIARGQWIAPLIIGLILCILAGMMLAAPTSVSGVMSGGVNVLDRKIVGLYETVTISGTDGKNIADWLNTITPTNMRAVALGMFLCGLFLIVLGLGLAFRAKWAIWLTIGESGFFIPIEIFELVRHHRLDASGLPRPELFPHPKIGLAIVLALNVLIVWYLLENRQRLFRHRR